MTDTIFFRIGDGRWSMRRRLRKQRGFWRMPKWRGRPVWREFCPCELCRLDYGRLAYPRTLSREKAITIGSGRNRSYLAAAAANDRAKRN